jgi:hypothetical protein
MWRALIKYWIENRKYWRASITYWIENIEIRLRSVFYYNKLRRSDGTLTRGLVCVTRIRSYTDLKDPDAHVLDGWVPATRKRCTKHAPSPESECGHLNGGKSKAVTYAFPPGYRKNAEEEDYNKSSVFISIQEDLQREKKLSKTRKTIREKKLYKTTLSQSQHMSRSYLAHLTLSQINSYLVPYKSFI